MLNLVSFVVLSAVSFYVVRATFRRVGSPQAAVRELIATCYPAPAQSPIGLQRRAMRRMLEQVSVGVSGQALVPTGFTIFVGPEDFETLAPLQSWFCSDLSVAFVTHARSRDWPASAALPVVLAVDDHRPQGAPLALATYAPATIMNVSEHPSSQDETTTRMSSDVTLTCGSDTWLVVGPATIGRDDASTITITDAGVSRRHARLEKDGDTWFVVDARSLNGTFVNGVRVDSRTALDDGDELRLGHSVVLRFTVAARRDQRAAR